MMGVVDLSRWIVGLSLREGGMVRLAQDDNFVVVFGSASCGVLRPL